MNFKNKPQPGSCFSSPPPLLLMRAICGTLCHCLRGAAQAGASMIGSCYSSRRTSLRRAALAQLALAGIVPAVAAAPLTLQVEVSDTLPGVHIGAFPGVVTWRCT